MNTRIRASLRFCPVLRSVGYGGLAALGDFAALARVRKLTSDPVPSTAINAIEWIAICRDSGSVPQLRQLLIDREVLIRVAAHKALAAMGMPDVEKPRGSQQVAASPRIRATLRPWWYVSAPVKFLALLALVLAPIFLRRKPAR